MHIHVVTEPYKGDYNRRPCTEAQVAYLFLKRVPCDKFPHTSTRSVGFGKDERKGRKRKAGRIGVIDGDRKDSRKAREEREERAEQGNY